MAKKASQKTPSNSVDLSKGKANKKQSDAKFDFSAFGQKTSITMQELIEYRNAWQKAYNESIEEEPIYEVGTEIVPDKEKTIFSEKLTFDLENLPENGAEDSGEVYQGHSIISKQLTKSTESQVYLGKKNTLPINLKMLDHESKVLDEPLTQYEGAVQQALYSLLDDGFLSVTGAQIYRKMKGNKKSNPQQEQKGIQDIDMAMKKLQAITVEISATREPTGIKDLGEIIKIEDAQKTTSISDTLASFVEQKTEIRGNVTTAYVMRPILDPKTKSYDPRPLIQRVEVSLKQFEKIPDELLAITKVNAKGEEVEIPLNKERIALRHYISDLVFMVRRTKDRYSNKRAYKDIFEACQIISKSQKKNLARYKTFIKDCLDFYQRRGIISDWTEYYNKGAAKRASGIEVFA